MNDLSNLNVTTTNGQVFTGEQSAVMAALIYKRFGCSLVVSLAAWQRLMQNNCPIDKFGDLVAAGLPFSP
jgi:hypothetical protein